ncbi:MAG: thioredoxin [Chlorobi bacterium]|nr:thioredoxin [Chlorobiota bacterium]
MKKLSLILVVLLTLASMSCSDAIGNQNSESVQGKNKTTVGVNDQDGKPEFLTYDTFLKKVWNFEKNPQQWVYEGDEPCVIDFYADWCRPCKMVAPIMEDLAKQYEGKVKIYKINVDKEKQLASIFQISSIPAVLFSPKEGKPMMQVGALPKDAYIKIINENLLNNK